MRLNKIKMAGFKSFVDPTVIHLPSNLVGIVGPNGCGKSNVIDAVRWVMGESSAKQLRGDSMADVIFNGSSARKPVSTASIELIFDNSDGAIGGQYANYAEISVKREVVRDGTSNYFLNNTRCRRRDIQDLFLGTGLGPRSYAIIEQGTISRLVESKPEELRMFLEEAAGISRYKERRHETENRIHHTKENIERLNDLLEEITKQLQHLQRQARAAERYKEMNEDKRRLEAELKVMHWQDLDTALGSQDHVIREREVQFEAALAEQRAIENELEKSRQCHDEANDGLNAVQGRYYELGTAIARLEQALQHARELRKRQQTDLEELEQHWREMEGHIKRDQQQIEQLTQAFAELEPAFKRVSGAGERSAAAMAEAEDALQDWQARWETFSLEAGEKNQVAEVARARIEHLERQLTQLLQRRDKLQQERSSLSPEGLQREIDSINGATQAADQAREQLQTELNRIVQDINTSRDAEQQLSGELHALRSSLEDQRGRVASLEALQQAALGKSRAQVTEWLQQKRLAGKPRLAELISVAAGWERAVETVLGYHLEAVCVEEFVELPGELATLTGGSLSFVERSPVAMQAVGDTLLAKIETPLPLDGLLGQVRVAEDLAAALALRGKLVATESVITRDGVWLGRHWVRVVRDHDERAGVIGREQELKQLKMALADMERGVEQHTVRQENARRQLRELEASREGLHADVNRAHRQYADTGARLKTTQGRLEQIAERIAGLDTEAVETRMQLAVTEAEIKTLRAHLEAALDIMQHMETRRQELQEERETLRLRLEQARSRARSDTDAAHDIALKLESRRSLKESTEQNLARMQAQLGQMQSRRTELRQAIEDSVKPVRQQETELHGLLNRRTGVDAELSEARRTVEMVAEQVRALEQRRLSCERKAEELRDGVQQLRLGTQEIRVRRETLVEQLQHDGYALDEVLHAMPENAGIPEWSMKLTDTEQ
ncbi:MAG: chromosome segregation protein SMC, partial [Gammaproteobacteria bacterium]|nr:chromosome segregation protein SMC [Gammaproteobacteria bacterium]